MAGAQIDGNTAASNWPQYGMLIARNAASDRSGYFVVGALTLQL